MSLGLQFRDQILGEWDTAKGFIAQQFSALMAQLSALGPLARTLKTPYDKRAVLLTDENGNASFSRLPWINVPYVDTNYRAVTGTWTVEIADQQVYRYVVLGGIMFLRIDLSGTSTDASVGNDLRITLPDGWRAMQSQALGPVAWAAGTGNSPWGVVYGAAPPDDDEIRLLRDIGSPSTAWPASSVNTLHLTLNLVFQVYHPVLRPLQTGER